MFLISAAVVIVFVFVIRKIIYLKKPIFIYKNGLIEDRPIEMIGVLISFVVLATTAINAFLLKNKYSIIGILIYLGITILLFTLTIIDYKRYQVGIYDNGILYRSIFYNWKRIYTYRKEEISESKDSIIFYIHDKNDEQKLTKFKIIESKENSIRIIEAIGENLDPTKS
ncbi:hypothetical protein [Miniphocaeibacter massiliensis]|uniref:hypothetical protein n=1 Tax=Miniphocaeibacter massiliensis TaxID=2041841 RepID=UPI000C06BBF9|nr:hypothetical protein [Miniphocaeibacter massiliensis]